MKDRDKTAFEKKYLVHSETYARQLEDSYNFGMAYIIGLIDALVDADFSAMEIKNTLHEAIGLKGDHLLYKSEVEEITRKKFK